MSKSTTAESKLPIQHFGQEHEFFASDLAAVEAIGPCVRLVFVVPRQAGEAAYREPIVSVVVPATALPDMLLLLAKPPRPIRKGEPEAVYEEENFRHTH
jgi:hypothetical protein